MFAPRGTSATRRQLAAPVRRQLACRRAVERADELRVRAAVGVHRRLPSRARCRAAIADRVEFALRIVGDTKGLVFGPTVGALGKPHLVGAEWLAVRLEGVVLVRAAEADVRAGHDERRS